MGRDAVTGELRVGGEESKSFALRLRDQHAVERVGVMEREMADGVCVSESYRKRAESASLHLERERFFKGRLHVQAPDGCLDADFPDGRCTDPDR